MISHTLTASSLRVGQRKDEEGGGGGDDNDGGDDGDAPDVGLDGVRVADRVEARLGRHNVRLDKLCSDDEKRQNDVKNKRTPSLLVNEISMSSVNPVPI